jgi:hypothetical protein
MLSSMVASGASRVVKSAPWAAMRTTRPSTALMRAISG